MSLSFLLPFRQTDPSIPQKLWGPTLVFLVYAGLWSGGFFPHVQIQHWARQVSVLENHMWRHEVCLSGAGSGLLCRGVAQLASGVCVGGAGGGNMEESEEPVLQEVAEMIHQPHFS